MPYAQGATVPVPVVSLLVPSFTPLIHHQPHSIYTQLYTQRTLCRSEASAPEMLFRLSLIMRSSASSCWIRNCSGRVLPELKASRARFTVLLILLIVTGESENFASEEGS